MAQDKRETALFNFNEVTPDRFVKKGVKYIPTGIPSFDDMTNDLPTKKVTVVTGVPKEGKSTFVHRIVLNAVDKGFKVLLIDGEHNRDDIIQRLYSMVIGNSPNAYKRDYENKHKVIIPNNTTIDRLKEWHQDRLLVFSKYLAPINDLETLFQFIEATVEAYDIDLVVADNLMMLVDGVSSEKNENQSRFMKRICDLAKFKNTHCIVVAHPNKGARRGEPMGMYDVLGSSDVVNLVDYLVQIMRVYDHIDHEGNSCQADAYARIILNRTRGRNICDIPLRFDEKTDALFQMKKDGEPLYYNFDWKRKGEQSWLKNEKPF